MLHDKLERFGLPLNLQFFNDGELETEVVDETPDAQLDDQTSEEETTGANDESFIDESLLTEEQKNSPEFKGYKSAYTRKTQEVAEFRKACDEIGLTPKRAAELLDKLQKDPEGLLNQLRPNRQAQTPKEEIPEIDPDEEMFEDDEYTQKLLSVAEKRAVTKAKEEAKKELIKELGLDEIAAKHKDQERETATKFLNEVKASINKVISDFPDAGVKYDQLYDIAHAKQILPDEMESALLFAIGPKKYAELRDKKAVSNFLKKSKENTESVAPLISGKDGVKPEQLNERPKTFNEFRNSDRYKKYLTPNN
jgi:hypothetical protein